MKKYFPFQCKIILLFLAILALGAVCHSQELKRKGSFDIKSKFLNQDLIESLNPISKKGLYVIEVLGEGTFENTGVEEGDIIRAINGITLTDFSSFSNPKLDLREGDSVLISLERNKELLSLKSIVVGKKRESSDYHEVIYGSAKFKESILSTIITKPIGEGPFPVILFIPGYSCMSLDNKNPIHPYRRIVEQFTAIGYAVYRIEKPGIGDSQGDLRCDEIDFLTEIEVFKTGYLDMSQKEFVDTTRRYIFGHSLGGYIAPILSAQVNSSGVIVYGTANGNWHEYLLQMVRFQNPQFGEDYVKVENDMTHYWDLFDGLCRQNKSPKELVKKNPGYKELLVTALQWDGNNKLLGRHYRFNNSIDEVNTTKGWSETEEPVLVLYGTSDFQAIDPRSSKEIVRIVNAYHPGNGTFKTIENTDHSMIETGDMEKTIGLYNTKEYLKLLETNFNYKIVPLIDNWIKEN